jgi:hypothetical protein
MATTAQININVNASQADKTVQQLNRDMTAAGGSAASLRAELRKVTQELQGLDAGSAKFAELSARAGQLRDRIADTSAVITATAGNAVENFGRALGNTVQIGVAGFQALSAAQVLFGTENEDLQRSLAQMGALLNLSQAIETFGGLGDKLTEIKAGFTPFLQQLGLMATTQTEVAVATGAADAAIVGEAVASEGAAVSTGVFAAALNALPFVAIISALGVLVAGLVSYASASGDAEKQEKKRAATLKAQREEEAKARKEIASESAEYVGLIYQLKATNAGSEERKKLIKDINATYGTTLKNLSDETAFQQQLNLEVANYITYQKAKFQLQKNEELVQKNLEKQAVLQKELTKVEALYNLEFNKKLGQDDLYAGQREQNLRDYKASINRIKGEIDAANKRLEAYGKVNLDVNGVIQEVTNNGKKYGDQTKKNTDATNDNTDALEKQKAALSNLKSLYDRQIAAEKELEALQESKMQMSLGGFSLVEDEFGNAIEKQNEFLDYTSKYFVDIFNIEQQFRDKQSNLIEQATQREIEELDQKYLDKKIKEKDYNEARKKIQAEGIKNLTKEELALLLISKEINDKEVQNYKDAWNLKEKIAQDSTKLTQAEIEKLTFDFDMKARIDAIEHSTQTEEEKNKAIIKIKSDYFDEEKRLIQNIANEQIELLKKQRDLELNNLDLTQSERLQITTKYDKQILDVEQNTQNAIQTAIDGTITVQKTQIETLQETLTEVDNYLGAVQSAFSDFEQTFTTFTQQQADIRTQAINDSLAQQRASLESNLAAGLISQEQYNNQLTQLEQRQQQEELQLKRKSFRQNKALNIVGATIDGARAVLSTFANTPGELIIKSIAAALAGVFAATQIALITRQEFTAATGGVVPGTGSGEIDSVPSKLAPGEAVINSKSTSAFLPLLSMINEAGGGKSLMPDLPAVNQGQRFEPVFGKEPVMQPIRAYVVESDISQSQRRVNRIINSTTF